ncbi:MAG: hypothetical protein ISP71_08975, partial [Flavobacteriales bacterium]|nr:hypothetical protein [Flavobacteriales bacterium]
MKAIFRLLLLMLFSQIVWAQTPGIPYQAVIMDKESGQELPGLDNSYANPLRNSLVSIRFSIHDLNGMEFEETHHSVIVDDYGMINLIVGKGVYTYMDFYDDMDWNGEEKWLKVEIDFENGNDFENLDYLPIHRIPNPDDQKLSLSGDSLILEDGGGVSLTDLLSGAGVDEQQISLVGNVIYLENGGSIDLTDLLANAGTDNQRLTLTGTLLNLEDGGTVDLANLLANVDTDNQNLTYISLNGTILEVDIEDGDSVSTNLVGLASDSAFVNNFIANQDFIDAIQLHELDGDPTNELNTNFTVLGNFLRITDGGGVLSVPLSMIQIDTMGLSNRIDQIILNDNDQDPTNEIQYLSISNDTLYLSDGNAVYLGAISSDNDQDSTNEIQTLSFSNDTLYLTEGGSVDLTSLALDLDTAYRQGDSLFIILDDFQDTTIVDLGSPDVGTDDQNLAYITLTGTDLEVGIEDGDSVKVDLIGLASDSTFVTTLAKDSVFSTTLATDSIFTTTLAH